MNDIPTTQDLILLETKRLAETYGKSFLDCEDIIKITGLGRENVRALISTKAFPAKKIGKRIIVSIINFVTWQISNQEEVPNGKTFAAWK